MSSTEQLLQIILRHISLSPAQRQLIEDSLTPKTLKKGETLLQQGAPNRVIGYLVAGLMRSFYYDPEGEEIMAGFFQEGSFCTDLHSFQASAKSERTIQALVDCKLLILSSTDRAKLLMLINEWTYFEQRHIAELLLQKVTFQRELSNGTAPEAYELFLKHYGQAARYAPRYQIASFLGMSPYTLSRIGNR